MIKFYVENSYLIKHLAEICIEVNATVNKLLTYMIDRYTVISNTSTNEANSKTV